ncbi:MAG TPA: helix-turn-helix domain-containing protein [Solirubrobacterales bacterium]|nr:helix-turn-helix domain-containing protein [Solirubrobacterales bacterium]
MARPRTHDIDALLDSAEQLLADKGGSGVTIRALAAATGASSGSLYHAFGSRADLLAHIWLRAANRFIDLQEEEVGGLKAERREPEDAIKATVAVASVPARIQAESPNTAKVLFRYRRDDILGQEISEDLKVRLESLDDRLLAVLRGLAEALWKRRDRPAVETVATCVVDLPTAILINRRERAIDPLITLEAAVRGVLQLTPPRPGSSRS